MPRPHLPRLLILALGILISLSYLAAAAEDADTMLDQQLHERVLGIPGDPTRPVTLQVTLFMPDGPGPFPLAVLNHGKDPINPRSEPRYRAVYAARYFVSRGFAAILPMLRGFAGSAGVFDPMGCDAEADGLNQAKDIGGVIDFIAPRLDCRARIFIRSYCLSPIRRRPILPS
jgi:X-Pro dipeptidyl-peptidase (S15 family)